MLITGTYTGSFSHFLNLLWSFDLQKDAYLKLAKKILDHVYILNAKSKENKINCKNDYLKLKVPQQHAADHYWAQFLGFPIKLKIYKFCHKTTPENVVYINYK